MKKFLLKSLPTILATIILLGTGQIFASNLANRDLSFDTGLYKGFYGSVENMVSQKDGKIIVAGGFTSYRSKSFPRIVRLYGDLSIDTSFNIGSGFNNTTYGVAIQEDAKILIGGKFTTYQGVDANRIIRLNADGSRDSGFNIGSGFDGQVNSIAVQSNSGIIIGGNFSSYQGVAANKIIRLNADGSRDSGFNIGNGFNGNIYTIAIQSDGKILVGGDFTTYQGVAANRIIRLNADGSRDSGFNIGDGFNSDVYTIAIQSDGEILVGGNFYRYQGRDANKLIRLNADGSKDTSFGIGNGFDSEVNTIAIQSDGKILVGGNFMGYGSTVTMKTARLNSNGTLDTTFDVGYGASSYLNIGFDGFITSILILPDGKTIIGGSFSTYQSTITPHGILKLNTNGSKSSFFKLRGGFDKNNINDIAVQADGKVIIGGWSLYSYDQTTISNIVRLNSDASVDTGFDMGTGFNNTVDALAIQSDGKILVGGMFSMYKGQRVNSTIRLNANGSIDTGFTSTIYDPKTIVVQNDGKILLGGTFSRNLVRLNADGSSDTNFNTGAGFNNQRVASIVIQNDGKILVGGNFTSYQGVAANRIIRLNTDGSRDTGFNIGNGFNDRIRTIAFQSGGKIVVGGDFTTYQGAPANRIIKLNSDGSRDTGFDIGSGFNNQVNSIYVNSDGKTVVGGEFTNYKGVVANRIIGLNSDGSIDNDFVIGVGTSAGVNKIVAQADGKILVAGGFGMYQGVAVGGLTRIYGDSNMVLLPNSNNTQIVNDSFTSKGYIENNGTLEGSVPISFKETAGIIPKDLTLISNGITLAITENTQFINDNIDYSGIFILPVIRSIDSIADMPILSAFNIGGKLGTLEHIILSGGSVTIGVPISGDIGNIVNIYSSDDNGISWSPYTTTTVNNENGDPSIVFTIDKLNDFALLNGEPSYTISYSSTTSTRDDVIATLHITNGTVIGDSTHTFTGNGDFNFIFENAVGNTGYAVASVSRIDRTAPVISLSGESSLSISQGSTYSDAGATASDDADGDISSTIVINSDVDASIIGVYTVTYNVSDAAGNPAQEVTRTVTVVADTTPPVITLNGSDSISVDQGSSYSDDGATASDNADGDISSNIVVSDSVNTAVPGIYTVTYNVSDAAGNTAQEVTRTVTVVAVKLTGCTNTNADNYTETAIFDDGSCRIDLNSGNIVSKYSCAVDDTSCDFSYQNITSIAPDTFVNHINLQTLRLYQNQLTSLPSGIFDNLTNLNYLDISYNQLTSLPVAVFSGLSQLTYLNFGYNQLTSLPSGIFDNLTNLNYLDISYNKFTALPSGIFDNLTNLNEGYLNNNPITALQSGAFDNLTTLSSLDISSTCGTDLFSLGSYACSDDQSETEETCLESRYCTDNTSTDKTNCEAASYCDDGNSLDKPSCEANQSNWLSGSWEPVNSWYNTFTPEMDTYGCALVLENSNDFLSIQLTKHYSNNGGIAGLDESYYFGKLALGFTADTNSFPQNIVMISSNDNGYSSDYYNMTTEVQYNSGTTVFDNGAAFTGVVHNPVLFPTVNVSGMTNVTTLIRFGALTHRITFSQPITVRIPTLGKQVGDKLSIYSSDKESIYTTQPEWTFEQTGTVIDIDGTPYLEFTTSHDGRYVLAEKIETTTSNGSGSSNTSGSTNSGTFNGGSSNGGSSIGGGSYHSNPVTSIIDKIKDIIKGVTTDIPEKIGNIKDSPYPTEMNNAYLWAYTAGITTQPSIQQANISGKLIRKDMAKMISNFAINVLKKTLNTGTNCSFSDMTTQPKEAQNYATAACKLGLMGYASDGKTLKATFDPNAEVDRAQFGTILSRLLYGNTYNGGKIYYQNHLDVLKNDGIMTKIETPFQKEIRGYVMLMMQRASK